MENTIRSSKRTGNSPAVMAFTAFALLTIIVTYVVLMVNRVQEQDRNRVEAAVEKQAAIAKNRKAIEQAGFQVAWIGLPYQGVTLKIGSCQLSAVYEILNGGPKLHLIRGDTAIYFSKPEEIPKLDTACTAG